jgi:DNA-binding NarL/FixJ family response regulator
MASWIAGSGVEVVQLSSAAAARRLLSSSEANLIVCEGSIEGREHSEVQQVRTAAGSRIPILALLSSCRIEDFARTYADGASAILTRPVSQYQLSEAVKRLSSRPHVPRENQSSDPLLGL